MRFQFFRHLPQTSIASIDDDIRKEVIPFVKRLADLPQPIQDGAKQLAEMLDPPNFFYGLHSAWQAHNYTATVIDRFLDKVYGQRPLLRERAILEEMRTLLQRALETEDCKRRFSAAVKLVLERYTPNIGSRYSLSLEEIFLVITPSTPNFWTTYQGEHILLIHERLIRPRIAASLASHLCDWFHAGEKTLLEARLARDFAPYSHWTPKELRPLVRKYSAIKTRLETLRMPAFYVTHERPWLRAIQNIIQYDNFDEYLWAHSLYGMPDLFLRRLAIELCVKNGLLDERPSVLLYRPDELLDATTSLLFERRQSGKLLI